MRRVTVAMLGLLGAGPLFGAPALAADKLATYADPVPYCKAVHTVDAPDSHYKGAAVPRWMVLALYTPEEIKAQKSAGVDPARAVVWRCMEGKVFGCVQANSPICGKANQDKTPTKAMADFCASSPNAAVIPLAVIGHENPMIYDWTCKRTTPTLTWQIFTVDAQGFPVELWKAIAPAGK